MRPTSGRNGAPKARLYLHARMDAALRQDFASPAEFFLSGAWTIRRESTFRDSDRKNGHVTAKMALIRPSNQGASPTHDELRRIVIVPATWTQHMNSTSRPRCSPEPFCCDAVNLHRPCLSTARLRVILAGVQPCRCPPDNSTHEHT